MLLSLTQKCFALLPLLLNTVSCLPQPSSAALAQRTSSGPLVFAHYLLISQPLNNDYTKDITLAKEAGIDAFAVNYGGWNANFDQQAGYLARFYAQAAALSFKLFLSFDLTSVTSASMIVNLTNTYSAHPAQLHVDGKPMLSTFQTTDPAWNWKTDVLDHLTHAPLFIPGTMSNTAEWAFQHSNSYADGLFPWIHPTLTTSQESAIDAEYAGNRSSFNNKKWIAPVAPWFFKRFGADMNWLHAQDDGIWIHKWLHLLKLKPDFIEIVTWNDWGESSYIGPANPAAKGEDNGGCYWSFYDHTAFRGMTKLFSRAFHEGKEQVNVGREEEDVYMFYRTQPALTNGVQDAQPLPANASSLQDNVYVVSFLNASATITLESGDSAPVSWVAGPGVQKKAVSWSLGEQRLSAERKDDEGFRVSKKGLPVSGQYQDYNGNVVAV